jgi:pimeloyl-ACP methyl ester carboxylesterase/DNA-binding CsgD family transcriptional regulator
VAIPALSKDEQPDPVGDEPPQWGTFGMGTCGVAAYKPYIGAVRPETRYAKSGDVSVAYQVIGEGSIDLVLVPGFVSHVELAWEEPNLARVLTTLASFSRLIIFDKRGTGMSDPMTAAPSMEARMDDIRAVMDAVGSPCAALFGISDGGSLSLLFALRHRDRTRALILYGSWARRTAAPDYPWGPTADQLEEMLAGMDRAWATGEWWDRVQRSPHDDQRHQEWWARYLRMGASPTMARDVMRMNAQMDLRGVLPHIAVPTLILHREHDSWIDVGHGRYLAEHIPGARYVELPGSDHRPWLDDTETILAELEVFLLGSRRRTRRRSSFGVAALSRREREVAAMAARGATAPDIAAHLFVSTRTVETQLASIYTKLGLHSRSELIQRARELSI